MPMPALSLCRPEVSEAASAVHALLCRSSWVGMPHGRRAEAGRARVDLCRHALLDGSFLRSVRAGRQVRLERLQSRIHVATWVHSQSILAEGDGLPRGRLACAMARGHAGPDGLVAPPSALDGCEDARAIARDGMRGRHHGLRAHLVGRVVALVLADAGRLTLTHVRRGGGRGRSEGRSTRVWRVRGAPGCCSCFDQS